MAEQKRIVAVTGAASGLGAALVERIRAKGDTPVGIDLRGSDVDADLGTDAGREHAIAAVLDRCGGRLDGLVVAAAVGPYAEPPEIVSVDYFGSMRLVDGLREALGRGRSPAAVAISSIGGFFDGAIVPELLAACLADDEPAALAASPAGDGTRAYSTVKRALIVAVRHRAAEWGGSGIRLNTVVPGNMQTPMLDGVLADPVIGAQTRALPIPLARDGAPEEVAAVAAFLLGEEASYVHGAFVPVDGGVLANLQPDPFGAPPPGGGEPGA